MSSRRPRVRLRPAHGDDAQQLFGWANDATVRERSISTETIGWDEHIRWLDGVLSDPDRALYILEVDGAPAGQIRFDRNGDSAEVSVSIDRARRGEGLGVQVLELGMVQARQDLEVQHFVALIRPGNRASRRVFEKVGYQPVRHVERQGVELLQLEREKEARGKMDPACNVGDRTHRRHGGHE